MKKKKIAKIKQGQAIFFASFIRHRVTPVTRGVRKSLVMWFGGTPFKMIKEQFFPTIIYAKDVKLDNQLFENAVIEWSQKDKGVKRTNVMVGTVQQTCIKYLCSNL